MIPPRPAACNLKQLGLTYAVNPSPGRLRWLKVMNNCAEARALLATTSTVTSSDSQCFQIEDCTRDAGTTVTFMVLSTPAGDALIDEHDQQAITAARRP